MRRTSLILILLFGSCLMGFFSQCLAEDEGKYAPKDAYIAASGHYYYYSRDHGGCTTTPTMNYAVSTVFALGD